MVENPIVEWLRKLGSVGRKIDSFKIEKIDAQKHLVELFERGEFIESIILHCQDKNLDTIVAQIEAEIRSSNRLIP